jgi:hypothetical protein
MKKALMFFLVACLFAVVMAGFSLRQRDVEGVAWGLAEGAILLGIWWSMRNEPNP